MRGHAHVYITLGRHEESDEEVCQRGFVGKKDYLLYASIQSVTVDGICIVVCVCPPSTVKKAVTACAVWYHQGTTITPLA